MTRMKGKKGGRLRGSTPGGEKKKKISPMVPTTQKKAWPSGGKKKKRKNPGLTSHVGRRRNSG